MITLTCTNCKAQLEMDDAFAGGVCRCMYCGTIQTVPSHLKRPGAVRKVKTLYKQNPRPTSAGAAGPAGSTAPSDLDQLAGAVAQSGSGLAGSGLTGSGLSGSGLPSPRVRLERLPPARRSISQRFAEHRMIALAAGGAVLSLILLAILLFAFSGDSSSGQADATLALNAPSPAADSATDRDLARANFCGVELASDRTVIYVLDRGSATGEMFAHLKEACCRSIESLADHQKFQIIFWNTGSGEEAFPAEGPVLATPANLTAARRALDAIHAHGQSDARPALARAFAQKPDVIVLATGKAYEVDDAFVQSVEQLRRSGGVKIHTFALGGGEDSARAFKLISRTSGGEHRLVPAGRLREYAQ